MPIVTVSKSMNDKLTEVTIADLTIWFSYETPVAVWYPGRGLMVSENIWSQTTNRHLNDIERRFGESRKDRLPTQQFREAYAGLMVRLTDAIDTLKLPED